MGLSLNTVDLTRMLAAASADLEVGGGSSDGANPGVSAERHAAQRSRDPGRADGDGPRRHDRCRARRDRPAEPAPAAAAGAAGGLLTRGPWGSRHRLPPAR